MERNEREGNRFWGLSMKTHLYYYSGTGNALWAARQLAARLDGETELVALRTDSPLPDMPADRAGLVFPVHMWGLPRRIVEFVGRFSGQPDGYHFAVAVNAGQVAASLLQLRQLLQQRGLMLQAGFSLLTPSNYILWNGAQPEAKQQELFVQAGQKLDLIAAIVRERTSLPVEQGPWWQNPFLSLAYRFAYPKVAAMDKDFWTEPACNGCGLCARVCPAGNILLEAGRPVWQRRCEQCLACIQWCPQQAVQYGQKTAGKLRYHHPEVSLADMVATRPQNGNPAIN